MTDRSTTTKFRVGDRVTVHLNDLGYLGEAIGRVDNQVVFVGYGIPGEDVAAEVVDRRSRFLRARTIEVLTPSSRRTEPACGIFAQCGGCQFQHIEYAAQVEYKTALVVQQMQRIGGFEEPPVRPMIPAAHPWHYRNHARFQTDREGRLCFSRVQSHDLIDIPTCWLMMEPINDALVKLHCHAHGLHQVSIRYGAHTHQVLISPHIPTLDDVLPTGQASYEEVLVGRTFRVSESSFFQVNTRPVERDLPDVLKASWLTDRRGAFSQADLLAITVLDHLDADGDEVLVDAYCGVGTFALLAADRVKRVIGIEESKSAIRDAEINRRGVDNCMFIRGRTEEVLPELEERVDVVVLDPSRLGCDSRVMTSLIKIRPRKVIYVSCDPATLARDLGVLCDWGYDLLEVQPIDMFPQTYHIENVAVLRLRE